MGGVSTSIKDKYAPSCLKIAEGISEEYLITRHGQFNPAINVINLYGAQESRQTAEEIREGWDKILEEIVKIEAKLESLVLLGDLNRHLSNVLIKENHVKSSLGGRLLMEFVTKGDYTLVNAMSCVEGGPFTRYDKNDPTNKDKKSLLDLMVISNDLVPYVNKLKIDNNLEWTPSRSYKGKLKYPDHYALLLILKGIPMKTIKPLNGLKTVRWNTRKKGGWDKYKHKTENNIKLLKSSELKNEEPEIILKGIEKELTKVKFASFGKVKVHTKTKDQKKMDNLQTEKLKIIGDNPVNKTFLIESIDKKMSATLKSIEQNKFDKDMNELQRIKYTKGKAAAVFSLKDKVLGKKKTQQEQVVVTDPETGVDVYCPEEIKRVSLNFCVNLLKTKEPKEDYKELIARKKELHYQRMIERIPNDLEDLPVESFYKVLNTLIKKPGNKYEFITKSGSSLKDALLNLFQNVWRTEKIPEAWQVSTVTQLWKGKGKPSELSMNRHIHSRDQTAKKISQIVLSHAKVNLLENMSKYQIACKPGHRPSEHLFVIKSVFAQYQINKKGLILTGYDICTFFDSEDCYDVFNEVYANQVKGKIYRLLF